MDYKTVRKIVKHYIHMVIDAEWRSRVEKNPIYEDWIIMNFNISGIITELVDGNYITNDEVVEIANSIRRTYTWV